MILWLSTSPTRHLLTEFSFYLCHIEAALQLMAGTSFTILHVQMAYGTYNLHRESTSNPSARNPPDTVLRPKLTLPGLHASSNCSRKLVRLSSSASPSGGRRGTTLPASCGYLDLSPPSVVSASTASGSLGLGATCPKRWRSPSPSRQRNSWIQY